MPMHIGMRVEIVLGLLGFSTRVVLPCVLVLGSKHFLEVDFFTNKVFMTHSLSFCFFFSLLSHWFCHYAGSWTSSLRDCTVTVRQEKKILPPKKDTLVPRKKCPHHSRKVPRAARLTPTHPLISVSKKLKCLPLARGFDPAHLGCLCVGCHLKLILGRGMSWYDLKWAEMAFQAQKWA